MDVDEEMRQRAMPCLLSSSRPTDGQQIAFTAGCGGLGPGGVGRAHRIVDLMSGESLSGRPRSLVRNGCHQVELEPHVCGAES